MDRRNFVANSVIASGLAAAASLAVQAAEKSAEPKSKALFKLGFLTQYSPEIVALAKEYGYDCLSVQMSLRNPHWESLKTPDGQKKFLEVFQKNEIQITSFADYANHLDPDPQKREFNNTFTAELIDVAEKMGVKIIAALCGRDPSKSIDDSLDDFKSVWGPLAKQAEDKGIKIAFENWVGGSDISHGINLAVNPYAWTKMFETVPSSALGLEFDASHLYWQGIDYLRAVREFSKKIFQVHLKDCIIQPESLYQRGCTGMAFQFCLPGWGDIQWPVLFRALWDGGFRGNLVVEHEDDLYQKERYTDGFRVARAYLDTILPRG